MTALDLGLPTIDGLEGVPTTDEPQKAKDYKSNQEVRWCPGCGDHIVLNDDAAREQVEAAKAAKRADLGKLMHGNDTWTVAAD